VTVVGVDGCRAGWAVAALDDDGSLGVSVVAAIAPVVAQVGARRVRAMAVDMPIGLPTDGRRVCDVLVRRSLGARRGSVFPTPARAVLGASDHAEACERSAAVCGRRLSRQTYNLLPRIAELDAAMTPARQERIVEAHPELAFARLAGEPMAHPKRTAAGRRERHDVLVAHLAVVVPPPPRGAAADDVLDAVALALVARALDGGRAEHVGDGACDARGLRMEIVTLPADSRGFR
jgi:predicted RNase H-like nuclease